MRDRSLVPYCTSCGGPPPVKTPATAASARRCPVHTQPVWHLPPELLPGALVDERFTLLAPLGRGRVGLVYTARRHPEDADVLIELVQPATDALAPSQATPFLREARAWGAITHPAVLSVIAWGTCPDGTCYRATERPVGRRLADHLRAEGLRAADALAIAAHLADALADIHRAGLVHGELRPTNILAPGAEFDPARVRLIGFALALDADPQRDRTRGGAPWASPEQLRGRRLGSAADLYALGAVLYEALTGAPPFGTEPAAQVVRGHLDHPPEPPSARRLEPGLPASVDALCLSLLAKNPTDRPGDAAEVAERLRALEQQLRAAPPRAATTTRTGPELAPPGFTGRAPQKAAAIRMLDDALNLESGRLLWIEGERGLGKSRLADFVKGEARQRGMRVLDVREAPELVELAAALGLGAAAGGPDASPGRLQAAARAIATAANRGPPVLIADDVDGERPLPPELLGALARQLATLGKPALLVLVLQRQPGPASTDPALVEAQRLLGEGFRALGLLALQDTDMRLLVLSALPGADAPLVEHVVQSAAGSPLRALELLRERVSRGDIVETPTGWTLRAQILPPFEREILGRRLASLRAIEPGGESAHGILLRLALLGPRVPHRLLRTLLRREGRPDAVEPLDLDLALLVTTGWIRDDQRTGGARFLHLRNEAWREALLAAIPEGPDRRRLFSLAAQSLAAIYRDHRGRWGPLIGAHLAEAGERGQAVYQFVEAARDAERRKVFGEALAAWQRAATLVDAEDTPMTAATIWRGLATMLIAGGRHVVAAPWVERLPDEAPRLELMGDLREAGADDRGAVHLFEEALNAWMDGADQAQAARVAVKLGRVLWRCGETARASQCFEQARLVGAEHDLPELAWEALAHLANTVLHAGSPRGALKLLEGAPAPIDDLSRARARVVEGAALLALGIDERAALACDDALERYERVGLARCRNLALRLRARALAAASRFDEAEVLAHQTLALSGTIGDQRGTARSLLALTEIASLRGQHDAALEWGERALDASDELPLTHDRTFALVITGEAAAAADLLEVADARLTQAHRLLAGRDGSGLLLAQAAAALADVRARRGDDTAPALWEQAVSLYEQIGHIRRLAQLEARKPAP